MRYAAGGGQRLDGWLLAGVLALGAIARAAYVALAGQTRFDPWRHLALIRNLREDQGFTLFDGQPYLWHGPLWHGLAAWLPAGIRVEWWAAALSLGSVAWIFVLARGEGSDPESRRRAGTSAALLAALCGPAVAFTCHLGPEALALFTALAALWASGAARGAASAAGAGVAFGLAVVLRTNFAFLFPLALARLRTPQRLAAFAAGGALPLAATWLRNRAIVSRDPWVFTWDGLATPSDGFGLLSTLVFQLHPDVAEGLRRLHERTMPLPEWIQRADGVAWEGVALMLAGVVAVAWSRNRWLIAATALFFGYALLFDRTLSTHHFRLWLPLLPVFFLAIARLAASADRRRAGAAGLAVLMLVAGVHSYRSPRMPELEAATPPAEMLTEDAYMVASGFFHPDSLVHRFPDKRFIGMPLGPERFEEYRRAFPAYRSILWHGYSVQGELGRYLTGSGRWRVVRTGTNEAGRRYSVLEEVPEREGAPR